MFKRKKQQPREVLTLTAGQVFIDPFKTGTKPPETLESAREYMLDMPLLKSETPASSPEQKFQADLAIKVGAFISMGTKLHDTILAGLSPEELVVIDNQKLYIGFQPITQFGSVKVDAKKNINDAQNPIQIRLVHDELKVKLSAWSSLTGRSADAIFETEEDGRTQQLIMMATDTPSEVDTRVYVGDRGVRNLGDQLYMFNNANEVLGSLAQSANIDLSA